MPKSFAMQIRRHGSSFCPYWLDPATLSFAIVTISLLCFQLIPESRFSSDFHQTKYDPAIVWTYYYWLLLFIVVGSLAGRLIGATAYPRSRDDGQRPATLAIIGYASLPLILLGYSAYALTSNASLGMFVDAIRGVPGANFALRDSFEKMPGITSLMNLACWWYVFIAHKFIIQKRPLTKSEIASSIFIVILSIVRGFAVNERRVIFEIFIPAIVTTIFFYTSMSRRNRNILLWGPLIGVAILVVVFLSTEYFRSWINFYSNKGDSYWSWAISRLGGYYATAINNGVTLSEAGITTNGAITLQGFLKFPLISEYLSLDRYYVPNMLQYKEALRVFTTQELNNPGGIIVPVLDFGWIGGTSVCLLFGIFSGITFEYARRGSTTGALLYSIVFFSILECTRVWQITGSMGVLNIGYVIFISAASAFLKPRDGNVSSNPNARQI